MSKFRTRIRDIGRAPGGMGFAAIARAERPRHVIVVAEAASADEANAAVEAGADAVVFGGAVPSGAPSRIPLGVRLEEATRDEVKAARDRKQPVLVDYTADWCASCKTLEKVAIETDGVRTAISTTGVLPMRADWTNENETIEKWLAEVGRNAIPTVVIYKPDGTFHLMPEVFTADQLVEALNTHGKGG